MSWPSFCGVYWYYFLPATESNLLVALDAWIWWVLLMFFSLSKLNFWHRNGRDSMIHHHSNFFQNLLDILFLPQLWKWKTGAASKHEYKPSHFPVQRIRARVSQRGFSDEFQQLEPKDWQASLRWGKHKDTPSYMFDGHNLARIGIFTTQVNAIRDNDSWCGCMKVGADSLENERMSPEHQPLEDVLKSSLFRGHLLVFGRVYSKPYFLLS